MCLVTHQDPMLDDKPSHNQRKPWNLAYGQWSDRQIYIYCGPKSKANRAAAIQMQSGQSTHSASVSSLSPDQHPARYRPWEQKDLLNRLKTFKPRNWFGKPFQVNAVSCARHGWINTGPDNLKCEVLHSFACYLRLQLTCSQGD